VAPWAILILAVWLWIAMIKQVLSRRTRRSRRGAAVEPGEPAPSAPEAEAAPATVVDGSIIPGLDGETHPLPRPASVRELEPVRDPAPPAENPWEAARLEPEPWEEDTEPVPAASSAERHESGEPAAWDTLSAGPAPETARAASAGAGPGEGAAAARSGEDEAPAGGESRRDPESAGHAEPASWRGEPGGEDGADSASDEPATGSWQLAGPGDSAPGREADEPAVGEATGPEPGGSVPPSWGGARTTDDEPDDTTADHAREPEDATADHGREPASPEARGDDHEHEAGDEPDDEPAPLLPPAPRRAAAGPERAAGRAASPAVPPAEDATEPESDVEAPVNDTPAQPAEEEPRPRYVARTSLPTDVRLVGPKSRTPLADTQPDGIRLPDTKPDGIPIVTAAADEEHDAYADERAEDPDAGMESTPPSSKFRSGPTPPRS
jgi:hypothetical protein